MRSLFARLHRRFGTPLPQTTKDQIANEKIADLTARYSFLTTTPAQRPQRNDVIVVGAGFAGLACALWMPSDWGVLLLEARDRVGGRVQTLTDFSNGRLIEGGAELIGFNHPMWLHFARRYGLALSMVTDASQFAGQNLQTPLYLGGEQVPADAHEAIYREMMDVLTFIAGETARVPNPYRPWDATDAATLDGQSLYEVLSQHWRSPWGQQALETEFANDNTVPTSMQSYLGVLAQIKGGDPSRYWDLVEVARCSTGNQSLAVHMYDEFGRTGGMARLQTSVTRIDVQSDGVEVTTSSGEVITARAVVLAIPPSMWGSIEFVQGAPPFAIQAGPAVKHLSQVSSRFWLTAGRAPVATSSDVGLTWEGTDNQTQIGDQGVELSVFAGADAAANAINAADPRAYYTQYLEQIYPGYSTALGDTRFMNWPADPWTRTGYSCPAKGQITAIGEALDVAFQSRIYFAGEYACYAFFGFMEGALQSGVATADRVGRSGL